MSSMSDTIVTETWPTKGGCTLYKLNMYTHTQMRGGFATIMGKYLYTRIVYDTQTFFVVNREVGVHLYAAQCSCFGLDWLEIR